MWLTTCRGSLLDLLDEEIGKDGGEIEGRKRGGRKERHDGLMLVS